MAIHQQSRFHFFRFLLKNAEKKQEEMLKNYINLFDRALRGTENDAQKWLQIPQSLASLFQLKSAFHILLFTVYELGPVLTWKQYKITTELYNNSWRECSQSKSEARNMANFFALTPDMVSKGDGNDHWQPRYNASGALLHPLAFFEKHFPIFCDPSVFFQTNLDIFLLCFSTWRSNCFCIQLGDAISR